MKIAITIWGNRISPVFDSADTLMIAEIKNSQIVSRIFEAFDPKASTQINSFFNHHKIDAFICGAITNIQSRQIEESGVQLISFITGNADKVLVSYIKKPQRISDFLMPGAILDSNLDKNFTSTDKRFI